jgi:hypothetical protein
LAVAFACLTAMAVAFTLVYVLWETIGQFWGKVLGTD